MRHACLFDQRSVFAHTASAPAPRVPVQGQPERSPKRLETGGLKVCAPHEESVDASQAMRPRCAQLNASEDQPCLFVPR